MGNSSKPSPSSTNPSTHEPNELSTKRQRPTRHHPPGGEQCTGQPQDSFEQLNAKREEGRTGHNGPTLYDELTEEFSRDQLNALLKLRERRTPARVFICQWSKRGLITPIGDDRYKKISKNQCQKSFER